MLSAILVAALASSCQPLSPDEKLMLWVRAVEPRFEGDELLARALIADALPTELVGLSTARRALEAEAGWRSRRDAVDTAELQIIAAERSFAELEDERALDLIASATPMLVAAQREPGAMEFLARAHLLAGAIFVARGHVDAAARRLGRALDIQPDLEPDANLRLLGLLEAVQTQQAHRLTGQLAIELSSTATVAEIYLDGHRWGTAPGLLKDIPEGRHLFRASAPGYRSYLGTVAIVAEETVRMPVRLAEDDVLAGIEGAAHRVSVGSSVDDAQAALTRRAEADRALIVAVTAGTARTAEGGLAPALVLDLEDGPRARMSELTRAAAQRAIDALGRCDIPEPPALSLAPPLPAAPVHPTSILLKPSPEPAIPAWAWVGAATLVLGAAAAVAIAHGASAEPDHVSVTLVPRP